MTDKQQMRAAARAARDAFVRTAHPPIRVDPGFLAMLSAGLTIASYVPIGSEADPAPLEHAAIAAGCTLALPHVVDRATPLRFLRWMSDEPLSPGPFGLRQPRREAEERAPDLVLTPLVAFDRDLNRLGQGAGHYDRAFAAYPDALRIGVAWSVQQVEALPADLWDVPLHAIVTEQQWISV
ncbi:5-formyltetrahydrofolate cyclo-ligase [Sphingomonas sp. BE138]|uniref:5-formyltetrahydrofolate cyclo-ligase n=1 Tax=Sphingomonas sp. BE138 TaxID=2817845 RepID=UPI00285A3D78|nr:5-formyltetrahydrofolate cyclo-ligase [Sphingomonas sp. BE138]MDR6789940.1 5-formyltetrahydrofolate cyclo-ligase [Sphingomonas sp. BE138]